MLFNGDFITLKGLSLGFTVGFGVFFVRWVFRLLIHTLYENERVLDV